MPVSGGLQRLFRRSTHLHHVRAGRDARRFALALYRYLTPGFMYCVGHDHSGCRHFFVNFRLNT
eukprot:1869436-Alexandrium_andersonii.AAC.1